MTALPVVFAIGYTGAVIMSRSATAGPTGAAATLDATASSYDDGHQHVIVSLDQRHTGGSVQDAVVRTVRAIPGVTEAANVSDGFIAAVGDIDESALEAVDGVDAVYDDLLLQPADDPNQWEQWALKNLGDPQQAAGWPGTAGVDTRATEAWPVSTGANQVVAVIDTGVDLTHEDLAANIWRNTAETCGNGTDDDRNGYVDDCAGWDFGGGDNDSSPDRGTSAWDHGTHVAGIIAAARNGVGVVGIAPDAKVMSVKVARNGGISLSSVAGAVRYATDNRATVINMSLATGPNTPRAAVTVLESAIAYAQQRGVVVVAGAGNNGIDITSSPVWPASYSLSYDNVITVSALTNSGTLASFSNVGSPISLAAPGYFIKSTVPGGYDWKSGTSMATPAVAAGAALVLAATPTTPGSVRSRLVSTARTLPAGMSLDVAEAVGVHRPTSDVTVSYSGTNTVAADRPSQVTVAVSTNGATPAAASVRFALAALVDGRVGAVSGATLGVTSTLTSGASMTSDDDGLYPALPVADTAALASGGNLELTLDLPVGRYALLTELLDASGTAIDGTRVGFFDVVDRPIPETTTPGPEITPPPSGAATTSPGVPTTSGGGSDPGGTGAPPTTVRSNVPGDGAVTPTTAADSPVTTSSARPTPTTISSGTPSPGTSAPVATNLPGGQEPTTTAASRTTTPVPPETNVPPTTVGGQGPSNGTATTTTAAATPDGFTLRAVSPTSGPVEGGQSVTVFGVFPTDRPVYVWFGGTATNAVTRSSGAITVLSPAHLAPDSVDIRVRFRGDNDSLQLLLPAAYAFVPGSRSVTTTPPATTVAGGGSSGTVPATAPSNGGGGAPATSDPPVTSGAPMTTGAPATTAAGGGSGGGAGGVSNPLPTRTLRDGIVWHADPTAGPVSALPASLWQAACASATCSTTRL
ncbi:MAG: S8 family serine peptidase [Ilumatobacteraceae bacterium]